jgi:D-3-phosphoglycerate dehydrogenase
MSNKILFLNQNHPILQKSLEDLGFTCEKDYSSNKKEIEERIDNYIGIVIRSRFPIDKYFIDAAPNLKFIARVGAGKESIDEVYANTKNIKVIAAPEGNKNAVGEHSLALLLALFRNINKADREVKQGKWLREDNRGVELDGKTVGIIGYGNMGKSFAKKLRGFDLTVICYDIKENVGDDNCKQVSLEILQKQADVVSLHTPHNELSNKMLNTAFINAFQKSFYLINTARGTAVVTDDLVKALQSKKIIGAGLDVLEYEKTSFENLFEQKTLPKSFSYLVKSDNVILSPHIAGWTVRSKKLLAEVIVSKIKDMNLHK